MKSAEQSLAEAITALDVAGLRNKFNEVVAAKKLVGKVEVQLNCANQILAESGIIESARGIKRGNGSQFSEGYERTPSARESEVANLMKMGFSEVEARIGAGLPARTAKELNLTETEYRQYAAYLGSGLSESEALLMIPSFDAKLKSAVRRGLTVPQFLSEAFRK